LQSGLKLVTLIYQQHNLIFLHRIPAKSRDLAQHYEYNSWINIQAFPDLGEKKEKQNNIFFKSAPDFSYRE
jgi:hypothetical protein